jgi:hypothetical protein
MNQNEKNAMIDARLKQYEQQIFALEIDRTALMAIEDTEGIKGIDQRIESLRKAYKAVEAMKEE